MTTQQPRIKEARIRIVEAYFRKINANDATVLDLFTEDVQMFFPKFGLGHSKAHMIQFSEIMGRHLERLEHDIENFNYIVAGDYVVVEGTERGVTREGVTWPDGLISEGRFCNVFDFRGDRIQRVFIYVDPDYTSADQERIAIFRGDQRNPIA